MSFLNIEGKNFLITGISNKKSVAYFVAKTLKDERANLYFSVQNQEQKERVQDYFDSENVIICDVENQDHIDAISRFFKDKDILLSGMLHSLAFANFSEGPKPFHETKLKDFLQATNISMFSLVSLSNALKDSFSKDASVVTISISNTKATNYGYLGPIKAALDTSICYLAKSFSDFSNIRFNAVCAGPLKTSASAGIPNYIENYLFVEKLTLRKKALMTQEVANTVTYLLSPRSSGHNASCLTIDAGMSSNYFDEEIVKQISNQDLL